MWGAIECPCDMEIIMKEFNEISLCKTSHTFEYLQLISAPHTYIQVYEKCLIVTKDAHTAVKLICCVYTHMMNMLYRQCSSAQNLITLYCDLILLLKNVIIRYACIPTHPNGFGIQALTLLNNINHLITPKAFIILTCFVCVCPKGDVIPRVLQICHPPPNVFLKPSDICEILPDLLKDWEDTCVLTEEIVNNLCMFIHYISTYLTDNPKARHTKDESLFHKAINFKSYPRIFKKLWSNNRRTACYSDSHWNSHSVEDDTRKYKLLEFYAIFITILSKMKKENVNNFSLLQNINLCKLRETSSMEERQAIIKTLMQEDYLQFGQDTKSALFFMSILQHVVHLCQTQLNEQLVDRCILDGLVFMILSYIFSLETGLDQNRHNSFDLRSVSNIQSLLKLNSHLKNAQPSLNMANMMHEALTMYHILHTGASFVLNDLLIVDPPIPITVQSILQEEEKKEEEEEEGIRNINNNYTDKLLYMLAETNNKIIGEHHLQIPQIVSDNLPPPQSPPLSSLSLSLALFDSKTDITLTNAYMYTRARLMCVLNHIHNKIYPGRCKKFVSLIKIKSHNRKRFGGADDADDARQSKRRRHNDNDNGHFYMIANRLTNQINKYVANNSDKPLRESLNEQEIIANNYYDNWEWYFDFDDDDEDDDDEQEEEAEGVPDFSNPSSQLVRLRIQPPHLDVNNHPPPPGKWVVGNSPQFLAALNEDAEMREILLFSHLLEVILRLPPTNFHMKNYAYHTGTRQLCFLPTLKFVTEPVDKLLVHTTHPSSTILGFQNLFLDGDNKLTIRKDYCDLSESTSRTPLYHIWLRGIEGSGNLIKRIPRTPWFSESKAMLSRIGSMFIENISFIGQSLCMYDLIHPYRYKHSALILEWFVRDVVRNINAVANLEQTHFDMVRRDPRNSFEIYRTDDIYMCYHDILAYNSGNWQAIPCSSMYSDH